MDVCWGRFESLPGGDHYPRWLSLPLPKGPLQMARLVGVWGSQRGFMQIKERERVRGWGRGETGGERSKCGEKKAFVKLKGRAPSDGVGQGKRVTGRSNW